MNRRIVLFFVVYILWLVIVSVFWYTEFIGFHWFNDVFEWMFMDKLGHFFTSFYMGCFCVEIIGQSDSSELAPQKPYLAFAGFFLLLPVEIMDGLSPNYGASYADLIFNGLGSVYCYMYLTNIKAHAIIPKFSFHYTTYAIMRPELLGNGLLQPIIKDYNGQTYWYSININQMIGKKIVPEWLLLSFGIGANGLLGGHDNVWRDKTGESKDYNSIPRSTQFVLSIDLDMNYLLKNYPRTKKALFFLRMIKFPAPAVEISMENGIVFHPVYF